MTILAMAAFPLAVLFCFWLGCQFAFIGEARDSWDMYSPWWKWREIASTSIGWFLVQLIVVPALVGCQCYYWFTHSKSPITHPGQDSN